MVPTQSLDAVIRRVEAPVKAEDNERLVIVEGKRKRAVPRRGLWGDYRQYLVRNSADPLHEARVEVGGVVLRDLDHEVTAAASLQLSCPPGSEERAAEAFFDLTRSPVDKLREHVTRWLSELCREDGVAGFVQRCTAGRTALQAELAETVRRETGMFARIKLSLEEEKSLEPIVIDLPRLPVLVKDYDEKQELQLRVSLEVDEASRAAAVLHLPRNQELPRQVREEVERYVRQSVSLHEFCTTLATGPAKDGMAAHLDHVLAPAGRRVGALVLQAREPQDVQQSLSVEEPVTCRVHEYPDPIVINNKVLFLLQDLAKYRRAGSPALQGWLREKLNRVIPQLLFDTRYIDLLISFGPVEGRIKDALQAEAGGIGYEIKQFVTVPDLKPIRLRDNFEVMIKGAFETALHGVDVNLDVVVTARIPRLEEIKDLLNRHRDVERLMEEAIRTELRQTLHGMDPERIYMRFHHSDPVRHPGERPVQEELRELLRARLEDREFHADVISIIIKMAETNLIERFNKLQERICSFAVQVSSFHGGPAVVFRGDFRVVRVHPDGWHTFQLVKSELDDIQKQVEKHLLARLQTMRAEELSYRRDDHRAAVEHMVTTAATRYVADAFGLTIEVTNVRRDLTGIEMDTNAEEENEYRARLELSDTYRTHRVLAEQEHNRARVAQIGQLLEKRSKLVDVEGAEDEVAELDAKIDALKGSLGEVRIPTLDKLRLDVLGAPPVPLALAATAAGPAAEPDEEPGISLDPANEL